MKKVTRKEIRLSIEWAIYETLTTYEISSPSRKSEKLLAGFSKKFADEIKRLLKKKDETAKKVQKTASGKGGKQVTKKIDN